MTKKSSALRSPWVIAWIAMVVIFFIMNMIMIYFATSGKPRLVVDDFYERGQDYENNMLKRQARNPGWQMKIDMPKKIEVGQSVVCRLTLLDKNGGPVTQKQAVFYAYRPSDANQDFNKPMQEIGPGLYSVEVSFPIKGAWDTLFSVKHGEDEYNTPKRIGVGIDWMP